jgi:hypothetical protein
MRRTTSNPAGKTTVRVEGKEAQQKSGSASEYSKLVSLTQKLLPVPQEEAEKSAKEATTRKSS